MTIWPAILGHANLLHHGLGWLEGGLTASFEKFIIDAEILQMMAEFLQPLTVTEDDLALEAISDVGPGGHFFGTPHTLARYEHAFYRPILSDWRNFETWFEDGAVGRHPARPSTVQRAADAISQAGARPGDQGRSRRLRRPAHRTRRCTGQLTRRPVPTCFALPARRPRVSRRAHSGGDRGTYSSIKDQEPLQCESAWKNDPPLAGGSSTSSLRNYAALGQPGPCRMHPCPDRP